MEHVKSHPTLDTVDPIHIYNLLTMARPQAEKIIWSPLDEKLGKVLGGELDR